MLDKIKESAKAVAGLVLLIATALTGTLVDEPAARIISIVIAVAGAVIIWATPNKEPQTKILGEDPEDDANAPLDEDVAGVLDPDYPEYDESAVDAEYPNAETLYQPGEKEGERFGAESTHVPDETGPNR